MGNAFRLQPGPTLYPENKTPVTEDLLEIGFLFAFGIIAFSFILIIPGIRGMERLWATLRVAVALWIGTVLLVCNFSYGWQADTVNVLTQYKAFTDDEIVADVGLHIGLRGVNITLKTTEPPPGDLAGEEINYNEQFWWADPWAQGRVGFGRYAGRFNQEFRAAQYRGSPYPILWVAEYFTLDGEQIRWGRKHRLAGWYTHQLLWLCFALYLLTLILFIFLIRYAAIMMAIMGFLMIFACFTYGVLILNIPPLVLPWNRPSCPMAGIDPTTCNIRMAPALHWCWYLTLFTGLATFFLALLILFLDYFFPRIIAPVFHHNIVEDDEFFAGGDEDETLEYGESSLPVRRGETGRTRRVGRGLTRLRQTQRKSRIERGSGSRRLKDEIPLEDIQPESKEPTKEEHAKL